MAVKRRTEVRPEIMKEYREKLEETGELLKTPISEESRISFRGSYTRLQTKICTDEETVRLKESATYNMRHRIVGRRRKLKQLIFIAQEMN